MPDRRARTIADEPLRRPERRVLDALAWLETIGASPAHDIAVACLAGYRVRSSGWVGIRRKLRRRGLIAHVGGPTSLTLTPEGRAHASLPAQPRNLTELHTLVLARLDELEGRILRTLLAIHPLGLDEAVLVRRCGPARDDAAFRGARDRLRELGLILAPLPARLRASDVLFHPRTMDPVQDTKPRYSPADTTPKGLRLVPGTLRFSTRTDQSRASS